MAKAVRWSEEQLEAFRKGRQLKTPNLPPPPARKESKLEIRFEQQLRVGEIEPWERNYFFLKERDYELDFAWPALKVGVLVNGGAHRASMRQLDRDCEAISLGVLAGWHILPLGRELVRNEKGIELLRILLVKARFDEL